MRRSHRRAAPTNVLAGHVGVASSDPNTPFNVQALPVEPADEFEAWAESRARAEDASQAGRYVSMEMTGYEALDSYGQWQNTPEYGDVWVPANVGADWAPYRVGRWVWVDPWGWTWIDAEPWGFAPFHYGRWAQYNGAWVWAPGVRVARPVYAPALVAFVGGGTWSVSARFGAGGGVAWFPLAPGEPWVPSYHASTTYVKNVNITNVHVTNINVTNVNVQNIHYKNVQVAGAVTAVPRETFVSAKPVRTAALPLQPQDVRQIHVVAHTPPVTPSAASRITPVSAHAAAPPPRVATHITELHAEPPPRPAPKPAPAVPPTKNEWAEHGRPRAGGSASARGRHRAAARGAVAAGARARAVAGQTSAGEGERAEGPGAAAECRPASRRRPKQWKRVTPPRTRRSTR